ncbi:cytochrome c biogenesis protein CcsA [Oleidesulfovibrio alaskensis]|uniref:cytochrome c biogenesis protein CcsA n=1 Tax=Oleidesulfovibrio alaskensis TaxID=58180 RepID=UPI001A3FF81F|nr:cytochrome c biogenesis protein CcsA [Oleidesulfovibrio alaskensis]MBL3581212.1 cytochrome c biogenesis protein CcsA [Oleidesulfovibrio alaskensis]
MRDSIRPRSPLPRYAAAMAGLALAVSQYFIFVYAPEEQTMGIVQKIFYIHLPLAWWALISFLAVFVASAMYLNKRTWFWDNLAGAAAEIGVLFSGLALVTGSVWGRHSWGVWWTWDPRLTTTLVMWFVYAGYLMLRSMGLARERRAVVCAVLGIVAFIDVPLVFFSARLWRSIHPSVFASRGGGLEPEMLTTAVVCVLCFGFLWYALTAIRTRQLADTDRLDSLATTDDL